MPYFRIPFSYRIAAVSAAATLGAALTLSAAQAAGAAPLPVPTGDMSLSPAGPDIVPPAAPATPGATPRASRRGSDTYTYLRCWYRIDADPLKPAATYEWARDPPAATGIACPATGGRTASRSGRTCSTARRRRTRSPTCAARRWPRKASGPTSCRR
ncbi:lipolytic enzyme, G-D-S-L domain protein, partial [Burkholderia cepacia]|nr:lipolytic enzyme, G-D-S-L domain protein [Burkholderia cepacia]